MSAVAGERRTLAFSIDFEGYAEAMEESFRVPAALPRFDVEPELRANADRTLSLLGKHRVHGTFFVLGWIAERFPAIVRDIVGAGHELGCHSYFHRRLDPFDAERADELRRAKETLEQVSGRRVVGFRAPDFALPENEEESRRLFDWLLELGFRYDSSVNPTTVHDVYGRAGPPRARSIAYPERPRRVSADDAAAVRPPTGHHGGRRRLLPALPVVVHPAATLLAIDRRQRPICTLTRSAATTLATLPHVAGFAGFGTAGKQRPSRPPIGVALSQDLRGDRSDARLSRGVSMSFRLSTGSDVRDPGRSKRGDERRDPSSSTSASFGIRQSIEQWRWRFSRQPVRTDSRHSLVAWDGRTLRRPVRLFDDAARTRWRADRCALMALDGMVDPAEHRRERTVLEARDRDPRLGSEIPEEQPRYGFPNEQLLPSLRREAWAGRSPGVPEVY